MYEETLLGEYEPEEEVNANGEGGGGVVSRSSPSSAPPSHASGKWHDHVVITSSQWEYDHEDRSNYWTHINPSIVHSDYISMRIKISEDNAAAATQTLKSYHGSSQSRETVPPITVSIPSNELTVIIGPTGCGKSTLLAGILGECCLLSGTVQMPSDSSVAYVSQSPWIQNATIRDNILFGSAYDAERYEEVVRVCALHPDLVKLPAGDMTEIGEKGINLSGGQQQRVALARAAYSMSPTVLLDDPLS
eukprot:gene43051-57264_t